MTVAKLSFKTDFTRFLTEGSKINHTVRVVTKTEVIECSGAVLCQHSEPLQQLVAKDNELFLDNYTHVQDCLLVLHGAEVTLDMENILDLMKFSIQFGVTEVYLQCLDWIEKNFSEDNFLDMFKICNCASKFANLCGIEFPNDVFIHAATYLKMVGPNYVMNLNKHDSGIDQIDFWEFLLGTNGLGSYFADVIIEMISEENIQAIFPLLCDNFDELKKLPLQSFQNLITKVDSTSVASIAPKVYGKFNQKLRSLLFEARPPFYSTDPHFIFDGVISLTDTMLKDKLWKKMSKDQIIEAQRLFETPPKHFIYSEMVIAWVAENRPTQEIVNEFAQTLKLHMLGADYISMFNEKCTAMGYTGPVSASLLSTWKRPNHYISNTSYYSQYNSKYYVTFSVLCRSACNPCSPRIYCVGFWMLQGGKLGIDWSWIHPAPDMNDFLKCPHDPVQGTDAVKGPPYFYGATNDNVHLQLHTDWDDFYNKWNAAGKKLSMGALQFDKVPD